VPVVAVKKGVTGYEADSNLKDIASVALKLEEF
jgi:hypothetical protein